MNKPLCINCFNKFCSFANLYIILLVCVCVCVLYVTLSMRISVHNKSPELFTVKLESPSRRPVLLSKSFPIDMRDDGSILPVSMVFFFFSFPFKCNRTIGSITHEQLTLHSPHWQHSSSPPWSTRRLDIERTSTSFTLLGLEVIVVLASITPLSVQARRPSKESKELAHFTMYQDSAIEFCRA